MNTIATLKSQWQWQAPYCRYALRLSLACFLTVALYTLCHIQNGYWAVFSVIACVWPTQGISLRRGRQRVIGTFLGMWLGIALAHSMIATGFIIDAVLPLFIFLMFYVKAYDYSVHVFFSTVVTMLFICLLDPGDWQMAVLRLEMTVVGVAIAFLTTVFVLPNHESQRFPQHLMAVNHSLKTYFSLLCAYYQGKEHKSLAAIQAQSFKYLTIALNAAQESTFEMGHARFARVRLQAAMRLVATYEKLLALDIHMPHLTICEELQWVVAPLGQSMAAMVPLFTDNDSMRIFQINRQLSELQAKIKAHRSRFAKNPDLKAAMLYDSMCLTIFIDTLQHLLVDLNTQD